MNEQAEKIELIRDEYIVITIGEYAIFADLMPQDNGEYTGRVYYRQYTKRLEISANSPHGALSMCKQWIADNPIIESDEVQA